MKVRVLTAVAALALAAAAPPITLDSLGSLASNDPPLVEVQTWIQHINVLTS
ncbi:hypothetical protein ACFLIM_37875 [Nonomuraea sp. M3C6]|uniref:Uncharacterized protein n=1 Tax=Nonomuraea marmarensis TaxID=3351344 RepID=A0ABW7ANJ9_9ACTN